MSLLIKPSAQPTGSTPLPWPAAIIVVVVVLAATASLLAGYTAAAALGLVGGAGLAGVEIVQRLAPTVRSGQ